MGVAWNRVLIGYSAILTTVLTGALVTQAVGGPAKAVFQEIDVQRINIREKDGTLRMVISNTDQMPGIIYKGTDYPHPNRKTAGMIFFNEEGTENGGLSFGGRRGCGARPAGGQARAGQARRSDPGRGPSIPRRPLPEGAAAAVRARGPHRAPRDGPGDGQAGRPSPARDRRFPQRPGRGGRTGGGRAVRARSARLTAPKLGAACIRPGQSIAAPAAGSQRV